MLVGGGPGGYVAAIKAAQEGLKVSQGVPTDHMGRVLIVVCRLLV